MELIELKSQFSVGTNLQGIPSVEDEIYKFMEEAHKQKNINSNTFYTRKRRDIKRANLIEDDL